MEEKQCPFCNKVFADATHLKAKIEKEFFDKNIIPVPDARIFFCKNCGLIRRQCQGKDFIVYEEKKLEPHERQKLQGLLAANPPPTWH